MTPPPTVSAVESPGVTLVAAFGVVLITALPPASPLALPGMSNMTSVSAGGLLHSRPPHEISIVIK
jgi:hypothetical protein